MANTLYNQIDPYLGSDGYLALKKGTFDNNVRSLNDRISAAQSRIDKSAESLRSQYEKLQVQLAAMIYMQNILTFL